jgi:hypothetical protein
VSDTHPRFIVAARPNLSDEYGGSTYMVVDTNLDSNRDGHVICESTSAGAHRVADSLNTHDNLAVLPKGRGA